MKFKMMTKNLKKIRGRKKMTDMKIFEANMTRYKILVGQFEGINSEMCFFTWLLNGVGGKTLTWKKGDDLYASYVLDKSGINMADLSGILSYIQSEYPNFISNLYEFDKNYYYN